MIIHEKIIINVTTMIGRYCYYLLVISFLRLFGRIKSYIHADIRFISYTHQSRNITSNNVLGMYRYFTFYKRKYSCSRCRHIVHTIFYIIILL